MKTEIIQELTEKVNNIKFQDFYDYFPQMIDDLLYIECDLQEKLEGLTDIELIDYNYQIQELVITYLAEVIKHYTKRILGIEFNYQFDEILMIGGCAAYDDKEDKILLSVIGLMIESVNTLSYIQPILHEFRHHQQHEFYKETNFMNLLQYPSYFFLIELHYIRNHNQEDSTFYLENYRNLYPEIDAEEYSSNIIKDIIPSLYYLYQKQMGENHPLQEKVNDLEKIIQEEINEIIEVLKRRKRIQTESSQELYRGNFAFSTFIVENKQTNSLVSINDYLEEHPELLNEYPHLKLLWNNTGIKDYQQLLEEKNFLLQLISNQEIKQIGDNQLTTTHQQIRNLYRDLIKISIELSNYKGKRKAKQ